jgi:hypothetical protein
MYRLCSPYGKLVAPPFHSVEQVGEKCPLWSLHSYISTSGAVCLYVAAIAGTGRLSCTNSLFSMISITVF